MKIPERSYCYVSTDDPRVFENSSASGLIPLGETGSRKIYFRAPAGSDDRYISVINDIGDYDTNRIREWLKAGGKGHPGHDSLVSAAFVDAEGMQCTGDRFGIGAHYCYFDRKTFCCSDNVFVVAWIAGAELSRESLWEYLFFLSPVKGRTWFDGVSKLRPGQSLSYKAIDHDLSISEPHDLFSILTADGGPDIEEAVDVFFSGAKGIVGRSGAAVSISAGSDSNTVLGCVKGAGIPFRGYSFGAPSMVETRHISNNARRLGFDWEMIDMTTFESSWKDRFRRTLLGTNGLLNPYRTHYEEFFNAIPAGSAVFEGVLGSELVKGEYAVGATIAKAHLDAITSEEAPGKVIEREFSDLPEQFRKDMADYISTEHGSWLQDVNTDRGAADFRSFVLEFAPGRILAGMILQGSTEHRMYEPFASPMILGAIFRSGLGIARDIGIRMDSRGSARVIEAEAIIARHMDKGVYENVLDRGVSFREVLTLPDWRLKLLNRYRNVLRKYRNRKYRFGQVDNRSVQRDVKSYAGGLSGRHDLIDILMHGEGHEKEKSTLGMIQEILGEGSE